MLKKFAAFSFILCLVSCTQRSGEQAKVVNLAIWSNYVSPELLEKFTQETGIRVEVSNYSSNEELLAKLQAGASGYDVVVPSDYMVQAMIHLGLLRKLDRSKVPNSKHLDPKLLKKDYDPKNEYSLPYDWGTTAIAVNTGRFAGKIKGWNDLFKSKELAGRFTLLDDPRETIGAALKSLGYSLNTTDPAKLEKAKELLIRLKPKVKGFTSEPMMPLVNNETTVAHAYMSDALQAGRKTGGRIQYILPQEGGTLWIDNLVIPGTSEHVEFAHRFINFLLDAASNRVTVESVLVAPANQKVFALLPKELQQNQALFPKSAILDRFEMMKDIGEATRLYDRIWTEVKSAQ